MSQVLRELEDGDREQSAALGALAFGSDPQAPPTPPPPGARAWGVFEDGRLLAKASVRAYEQWWGGRRVPMGGVAGVAVQPDVRGRGTARQLMGRLLGEMREAGQVVSALFPTAPGIYRGLGWEVAGSLDERRLSTALLRGARAGPVPGAGAGGGDEVRVRVAGPDDLAAVRALWQAYGEHAPGLLTREGPSFPDGPTRVLSRDVLALAEVAGRPVGYLSYDRGSGYGPGAELHVWELVAPGGPAAAALGRSVGAWDAVAPTTSWRGPVDDLGLLVGGTLPPPYESRAWMLRVVDAVEAVAQRGFDPGVRVEPGFTLVDPQLPAHERAWRLEVRDGRGTLLPAPGEELPRLHVRGLALLWAGVGSGPLLRAGLLERPVPGLDAAFAGPRPRMLDYF